MKRWRTCCAGPPSGRPPTRWTRPSGPAPAATLDRLLAPGRADRGAAATPPPALAADPYARLTSESTREQRQQANAERREQLQQVTGWWLDRMVAAEDGLTEKLLFFWHGHWATSAQKVKSGAADAAASWRRCAATDGGRCGPLVAAMVRDPALIIWLDGQKNTRKAPNENLARELMELFTLGIGDYTEADVKAGARALTGWVVDRRTGVARFEARRHDPGEKTILGQSGRFDAEAYAGLLAAQPAAATFVAGRLWFRYARHRGRRHRTAWPARTPPRPCARSSPRRPSPSPGARWSSSRWSGWSVRCASSASDPPPCPSSNANNCWPV